MLLRYTSTIYGYKNVTRNIIPYTEITFSLIYLFIILCNLVEKLTTDVTNSQILIWFSVDTFIIFTI